MPEEHDALDPTEISRPILADHEGLIAQLQGDERFRALLEALDAAEAEWHRRISDRMLHNSAAVDQRKIDETRGYFRGARYWLGGRMETAVKRVEVAKVSADPRPSEGKVDPRV